MILSAQTIRKLKLVEPLKEAYMDALGNSAGLSACGVDLTLAQDVELRYGDFVLASACEYFNLPHDVMGVVHDKSSLARGGLAVQNTVLEPGWRGYLTLELSYHKRGDGVFVGQKGSAIAQVVFQYLDKPTELPYCGKYQDQEQGPQPVRWGIVKTCTVFKENGDE